MSKDNLVLEVEDLKVRIGRKEIVRGISFGVQDGQTLGIVGESGSGKSMTVLAATGLLDAPGAEVTGASTLVGADGRSTALVGATPRALRSVHGNDIGFVFQDPSTSLNPLLTLERQITESLEAHRNLTRAKAKSRALELLEAVGIPRPESRLDAYPHQLSGGQRQRVMIAIALACDPKLLIADEPTTALDVTTQAQIIDLVKELQTERGTAVVWISHDLGVIGQVADDVVVLRHGEPVEHKEVRDLFAANEHPYTAELLAARPMLGKKPPPVATQDREVLLSVDDLTVSFPVSTPTGKETITAVRDASFTVRTGHTIGIVGESGSGKSTIANVLTGLIQPEKGTVRLGEVDVLGVKGKQARQLRRKIAMVFQDPFSSLNPRTTVGTAVAEPLIVHTLAKDAGARRARIKELFDLVGLPEALISRYPHELSGGQRQRVSIARALALNPELVILDESTASLDVSIQAKVLDLLKDLQSDLGLTYVFIAHDLAIVEEMSHEVLVLQGGNQVEYRPAGELFSDPREEYTKQLLAAIPPSEPAPVG